jgi:hypothetical protein
VIERPAGGRFFLFTQTIGDELQSSHVAAVALLPDGALAHHELGPCRRTAGTARAH